jgi:hypothetical protein
MLNPSRLQRCPIFTDEAADSRLQAVGIPGCDLLVHAVKVGAQSARLTTIHHPRSYQGVRMWAETYAALKRALHGQGWVGENFMGADLVLNERKGVAVIVTAGDSGTADADYNPQVRYDRQDVISGLVNGHADTLFGTGPAGRPDWSVWFLLHHFTRNRTAAELSRPNGIHRGLVSTWGERILLPHSDAQRPGREVVRPTPEIDVPVSRRFA